MKKIKKLVTSAAVCATACTMTLFAACGGNEPSDKLSADVKITHSLSAEQITAQTQRLSTAPEALSVNGGIKFTSVNGEDLESAFTVADLSVKANLGDLDADVEISVLEELFGFIGGGGSEDEISPLTEEELPDAEGGDESGEENDGENGEESDGEIGGEIGGDESTESGLITIRAYVRNGKTFLQDPDDPDLYIYNEDVLGMLPFGGSAGYASIVSDDEYVTDSSSWLGYITEFITPDVSTLVQLASATDSIVISESERTISFDINGMIYGVANTFKQIINNITENTTINGLLQCDAVKFYIDLLTKDMTAEDVLELVMGSMGSASTYDAASGNPLEAIAPLPDESVYEYLVRMLKSKDVAQLMGLKDPIGSFKLVDMFATSGNKSQALKMLKQNVSDMIDGVLSPEAITLAIGDGEISISNLSLVFSFDEQDNMQSVEISGNIEMAMGEDEVYEGEISLGATLSGEALELDDVDNYTVNITNEYGSVIDKSTIGEIAARDDELN